MNITGVHQINFTVDTLMRYKQPEIYEHSLKRATHPLYQLLADAFNQTNSVVHYEIVWLPPRIMGLQESVILAYKVALIIAHAKLSNCEVDEYTMNIVAPPSSDTWVYHVQRPYPSLGYETRVFKRVTVHWSEYEQVDIWQRTS